MTVQSTTARADYQGNNVTTLFTVPFYFLDNSHVKAIRTDNSTSPPTTATLVLGTDYVLTGAGVQIGGSIQTTVAPTASQVLTVLRNVPFTQLIHYVPNDPFPAATHEQALDQLTMEVQELNEVTSHALQLPTYEPVPPALPAASVRASQLLGFSPTGAPQMYPVTATIGAGDMRIEEWADGAGYTAGVSNGVTLSRTYGTAANLGTVVMQGIAQDPNSYSLSGTTLTFNAIIPVGVSKIWCIGGTTLSVGIPPNGSVGDPQLSWNSVLDRVCTNVAALQALDPTVYKRVRTTGYYNIGDGGAGIYFYNVSTPQSAANGFTIIAAAGGVGCWQLQLDGPPNFKQAGVKFDGATDNTAAINACLAAAGTGVIIAPQGFCNTTGNHTLQPGQYIVGGGKGVTTFFNTHATNDTFKITGSFCGISDCALSGTSGRSAGTHINVTAPSHTYIRRVTIFNFHVGISLAGVVQYIEDVDISLAATTTGCGILLAAGNDQFIKGVVMDCSTGPKSLAGLQVSNCFAAWVSDCDFIHCQNGVLLAPASGQTVEFMFFHNVACDTSTNNGWNITTTGTGVIYECAFSQCWAASNVNTGVFMLASSGTINGMAFSNTRVLNNGGDGVFAQGAVSNVSFTGGSISGNSQTAAFTQYGIHLGANVSDVLITGVRVGPTGNFADTQLAQVQVDAGSGTRIAVVGCDLTTANTPITLAATGTNNVIEGCVGFQQSGIVTATTDASGFITVTHGSGATPKTVVVSVSNTGAAIFAQPDLSTANTANFRVKFFTSAGAAMVSTGVSFSWRMGF